MSSLNVAAVSPSLGLATRPTGPADRAKPVTPADIAKVAKQFEAIIVRQLLKPAIDPIMGGGEMGQGGAIGGSGGGVYGYLLTDVLAGSLSNSGQLGFAKLIQQQLTPAGLASSATGTPGAAADTGVGLDPDADATSTTIEALAQLSPTP